MDTLKYATFLLPFTLFTVSEASDSGSFILTIRYSYFQAVSLPVNFVNGLKGTLFGLRTGSTGEISDGLDEKWFQLTSIHKENNPWLCQIFPNWKNFI